MPLRIPQAAPRRGGLRIPTTPTSAPVSDDTDEGFQYGPALLGGLGIAGVALLTRKSPASIRKALEYANAARQQLMLSGFALPKSLLGNVGAAGAYAAETRSLKPLKEMLSMRTLQEAKQAYKTGRSVGPVAGGVPGATLPGPVPGRVMGAFDVAARGALQRAGMTAKQAEAAVFQAPLEGKLGQALESAPARYLVPFRRTPFNQFIEGFDTLRKAEAGGAGANRGVLAGYMGAGALHGGATADDRAPLTVPLGIAASAKYGLPYGLGALAGRILAGGRITGENVTSSILPVSGYGITEALEDPLSPFTEPSALRALQQLAGKR